MENAIRTTAATLLKKKGRFGRASCRKLSGVFAASCRIGSGQATLARSVAIDPP